MRCWCSDIRWVGMVMACQFARERWLFEAAVDGLVSTVGVVEVMVVL